MCLLVGICKSAYAEEQKVSAACQIGDDRNKGNDVVDAVTFQAEVKRIERLMYRVAWSYLGNNQDVEDAVQETFLRAWRTGGLRVETERAWLVRVAANICRDHQRTRWFQLVDRDESALSQLSVPANQPESDVLEAVGALPIRLREVILLHYYQDMDAEEMASTLGVSISAVYRRLRKARGQLKKLLEGADGDE